jgi:hypothetical protein
VKLYVKEPGSRRLVDRKLGFLPSVGVYVSRLVFPETMSAITRRRNDHKLSPTAATDLWGAVASDFMRDIPP